MDGVAIGFAIHVVFAADNAQIGFIQCHIRQRNGILIGLAAFGVAMIGAIDPTANDFTA